MRIGDAGVFLINLNQRFGSVNGFLVNGSGQDGNKQHGKSGQNRPTALPNDSPPGQKVGGLFHRCRMDRSLYRAALFRANFPRREHFHLVLVVAVRSHVFTTCKLQRPQQSA